MTGDQGAPPGRGRGSLEPVASFGQTAPTSPAQAHRPATPFVRMPDGLVAPPAAQSRAPSAPPKVLLQLLWLDDNIGGRLRRRHEWRALIDAAENEPDLELEEGLAVEHRAADQPRDAFEVLSRATPTENRDLASALTAAARADGKLLAPLVVVAGELTLPFDPLARLKATHAAIAPLAAIDPEIRALVDPVTPYVERPEAAGGAESLTQYLLSRTRDKLSKLPRGQLESAVERTLLEQRAYGRRKVFGADHVRGTLGTNPAIIAYLPLPAAEMMPLFPTTEVRAIAELHPTQDGSEPFGAALRVRALARAWAV